MEEITLTAQPRTVTGKQVRQMRRAGQIPAVLYGHRTAPLSVQVSERELGLVLQRAGGNQLVRMHIGDAAAPRMVLMREVQREPVTRRVLHVDFYEVIMTERVRTTIPIVYTGASPAVKSGQGILVHGIEAVDVQCLPGDLIPQIEVSLDGLTELDQAITVGDLNLGDKIEVMNDPSDLLVRVIAAREEEIEEAAPAAESQVEVVKREKPEEGAEG